MKNQIVALWIAGAFALASTTANAALDDAKAQELLKSGGCAVCHTVDKKRMGPSFKDVAEKRKGQKDAVAVLEKRVRDGSKGEYGQMAMPPSPASKISDADLHDLMVWVLTK